MSIPLRYEAIGESVDECAHKWDHMDTRKRSLWAMMLGVSFGILWLVEKSWNDLPEDYRIELYDSWLEYVGG